MVGGEVVEAGGDQIMGTLQAMALFRNALWEFPGSPVVRTQRFHCQGSGSISGHGIEILQAAGRSQKKKEKKCFAAEGTFQVMLSRRAAGHS